MPRFNTPFSLQNLINEIPHTTPVVLGNAHPRPFPTVPTTPRPGSAGSDYYNLPQNGGGIMPPNLGSHGPTGPIVSPVHPWDNQNWLDNWINNHPRILDWVTAHPANVQAILQSLGIGGSATPLSGVARPGARSAW